MTKNFLVIDIDNSGLIAHRSRSSRKPPANLLSEFLVEEAKTGKLIDNKYNGFYVSTHRTYQGTRGEGGEAGLVESNIKTVESIKNYVAQHPSAASYYPADFSTVNADDEFTSKFVKHFSEATELKAIKVSTPGDIAYECGFVFEKILSAYEEAVLASKKKLTEVKNIEGTRSKGIWTTYNFNQNIEFSGILPEEKVNPTSKNQQYIQIAHHAAKSGETVRLIIMDDSLAILNNALLIDPCQLPKNVILEFYQHDAFELYDNLDKNPEPIPFVKIGSISTLEKEVKKDIFSEAKHFTAQCLTKLKKSQSGIISNEEEFGKALTLFLIDNECFRDKPKIELEQLIIDNITTIPLSTIKVFETPLKKWILDETALLKILNNSVSLTV